MIRATWVTNHPAPYRLPVWEHIGRTVTLDVALLASARQHAAASGNRGVEWTELSASGYGMREVPTWRLIRGESHFYITKPFALRLPQDTAAVVLGGWESPSYIQALLAAKRRGAATIGFYESTLHSQGHPTGPVATARRRFFERLDAVVVPGIAAEEAIRAMDLPRLKIFRGFNAVDVQGIHEAAAAARHLRPASEVVAGHRYLYLGQLIARKNVTTAIEAFNAAYRPGDTLTIAGTGELRDELEALGVPGVTFVGSIAYTAIPGLLSQHDTLVLPSASEVWGLVVNEALAAGMHAVISDRCGVAHSARGMAGVSVVAPTVEGVRDGLVASRASWAGPILQPEILKHGPAEFAQTFLDAIEYAIASRKVRR